MFLYFVWTESLHQYCWLGLLDVDVYTTCDESLF